MDRAAFLKSTCAYGLCGCVGLSVLTGGRLLAETNDDLKNPEPDWRIDFMQSRFKDLMTILHDTLDDETLIPILNRLGSKCGDGFAEKYKNNPDCFFDFIKGMWAESVEYDKGKGIIRVNEKIRETCNCPMVKEKQAPEILCNCSLGTQKRIYESLFGRPVHVTLEKSILRGNERCSFTIRLL